jgi:hypothetical protein
MRMLPEFLKVVKKALIILVLFVALDILFGFLYKSFYMNQGPSRFNKMIYGDTGGENEAIIILGDSRAEHHYNADMIADKTGKSVYNYGSDGQSVLFNYALLKKLLENYIPEKVIYEVSLAELEYSADAYDRLLYFLPMQNEYADQILEKRFGPLQLFVSKLLNSYKYNSTVFIILKSYLSPKEYLAGYQPLDNDVDQDFYKKYRSTIFDYTDNYAIDSLKMACFEEILKLSKEFDFKIVLFISPTLFQTENETLLSAINNSLLQYNLSLNCFLNDSLFNVSHFADAIHLNTEGADIFTEQVITILK